APRTGQLGARVDRLRVRVAQDLALALPVLPDRSTVDECGPFRALGLPVGPCTPGDVLSGVGRGRRGPARAWLSPADPSDHHVYGYERGAPGRVLAMGFWSPEGRLAQDNSRHRRSGRVIVGPAARRAPGAWSLSSAVWVPTQSSARARSGVSVV